MHPEGSKQIISAVDVQINGGLRLRLHEQTIPPQETGLHRANEASFFCANSDSAISYGSEI